MKTFSVVIPVLNESERINSLIENVFSLAADRSCEIIVVDGDDQGRTIAAIETGDVKTAVSKPGRAIQMNAGAKLAGGDVLIFLHADTEFPERAFASITHALEDARYVGGAFDLGVDTDNVFIKVIAAVSRVRNRVMRIPYGDQAIFVRKDYFERIGMFREIPVMEDVELMRRIKRKGDRICILADRVKTSVRRWEKEGVVYTTIRNLILVNLFYLGVDPEKLSRYYKS